MVTEHDHLRDLTGLYALGALSAAERTSFESHLASCNECRAEVRSFQPVAQGLLWEVPLREPPLDLRRRVLSSVAGVHDVPSRGGLSANLAWLAAAASIVIAVGVGWYATGLRNRIAALEVQLQDATVRAARAEQQMVAASQSAAQAQSTVAILAAPDLARIDLTGLGPAEQARGRAFFSQSRGRVFTAFNLPPLQAGRIYQLWVVTAQAPVSAGLIRPDAAGQATVILSPPPTSDSAAAVAVTLEPEGGVPAPTGDKYLLGMATTGL